MGRSWKAALVVLCLVGIMAVQGCGGGSGDNGSAYWRGDSSSTAQGYSVSGTVLNALSSAPVQGASCTLTQTKSRNLLQALTGASKETVTIGTAATDQNGQYRFTGVPSGTYTLSFAATDYVTLEANDLSVTQDTAGADYTMIQISLWTELAGSDYPYDANKDYVEVKADVSARAPKTAGITASITPSAGVRIGYFADSTPPTINWSASSTYSNGRIIFYGLTPGVSYTISFTLAGYSFPSFSIASPSRGGIVSSYNVYATAPTPTPSPAAPSPSPTSTPSPTPTPTQTGGGGGAATYTVTYNGNGNTGGTVPVDSATYSQGSTVTVLGNTGSLVKTGYALSGWNTNADGTGANYASSSTFTMGSSNVILYGKWTSSNPTIGAYQYVSKGIKGGRGSAGSPGTRGNGNTYTVTLNTDKSPQNGGEEGDLRYCITQANNNAGSSIEFSLGGGSETITIASALPNIGTTLTIDGANTGGSGTAVTVQVTSAYRVFSSSGTLELKNMTIKGGNVTSGNGGGILVSSGSLSMTDCTISGSAAVNGGGIYNAGTVTCSRCTISGCTASTSGGGIYNSGTLTCSNCTISGCTASSSGGGICNSGTVTFANCTISGCTASSSGGGTYNNNGNIYLLNSIVIDNTSKDLYNNGGGIFAYYCWYYSATGIITTQQLTAPCINDAYDSSKGLAALADNGGSTWTMAVKDGCPAIGKGIYVYYNTTDGFYLKDSNGDYRKLSNYDKFTPTSPDNDKITKDQRNVDR